MSRLYDALRRAEAERERIRNGGPAAHPLPPSEEAPRQPRVRVPAVPGLASLARGLLIFASGAALALAAMRIAPNLHSASPPVAQPPFAAAPATLKLDYRLDLTRKGDAAR